MAICDLPQVIAFVEARRHLANVADQEWLRGALRRMKNGSFPRLKVVPRLAEVTSTREEDILAFFNPDKRHPSIRMRCRECGKEHTYPAAQIIAGEKDGEAWFRATLNRKKKGTVPLTVDWTAGEGEYLCKSCGASKQGKARIARIVKEDGKAALYLAGKRQAEWLKRHPLVLKGALEKAHTAQRGKKLLYKSESDRALRRLGLLHLDLQGQWGLCPVCEHAVFQWTSDVAARSAGSGDHPALYHQVCQSRWRQTDDMRVWFSACRAARQSGTSPPETPRPKRRKGRRSSPEALAAMYRSTLIYLWWRYQINGVVTDAKGQPLKLKDSINQPTKLEDIAFHCGLTTPALYSRVKDFIALLPEADVAAGVMANLREIFLPLV